MRTIDADALKRDVCSYCEFRSCKYYAYGCGMMAFIDKQPTLDVIFVERSVDDIKHRDLVDEDGAELSTQTGDKMEKNQISFCNEFNALMEKYNITDMGADYDQSINFISNGINLKVNGYAPETGLQVFTKRGCISTKSDREDRE